MSENATTNDLIQIAGQIAKSLEPFASEERQRILQASLALLGDTSLAPAPMASVDDESSFGSNVPPSPKVKAWIKQTGISAEELQQVFHIEDGVAEMISPSVPGKNDKEQTLNTYILVGATAFLTTGTPHFDDKTARDLCHHLGCYSKSNHALYIKSKGNGFIGTKAKGWTLTSPGLKQAADLIKEMTKTAKA